MTSTSQSSDLHDKLTSLLLTMWEAQGKSDVRAWSLAVALSYILGQKPGPHKLADAWRLLEEEYIAHLRQRFPQEKDVAGSFKSAGERGWAEFLSAYITGSPSLQAAGVQSLILEEASLKSLAQMLKLEKPPKNRLIALLGLGPTGIACFGALFPALGPEPMSRSLEAQALALKDKGLWTGLASLGSGGILVTTAARTKIPKAFHAIYSAHEVPQAGPVKSIPGTPTAEGTPLGQDILEAWRKHQAAGQGEP